VVQSPGLMSGYLDRPDLTGAALRDGWFRTGDHGSVDNNGRIWLTGRIKDEINRAGLKVRPAEIDLLLEHHPAVAEACTFGIADPISGEIVAALVRLAKGTSASPESLRAWCNERMRKAAIPERWIFVDEIPRNARGKVSRDAVRRMFAEDIVVSTPSLVSAVGREMGKSRSPDPGAKTVRDAVERAWTAVLDKRTFAANLSWSDSGGDSLNALRLWFQIEAILGKHLSLDAMDLIATPSDIIAAIERMLDESPESSEPAHDGTPLVFFMPQAEGDSPQLARFRAAFRGKIRFIVVQYPSHRELIDAGVRFESIVNAAEAQIRAQCQSHVCFLVGYSFGGFVAWETALRLIQSGLQIGFLGFIDTTLGRLPRKGRLAFLVQLKAFWLLGPMGELAAKLRMKAAFRFLLRLNTELRHHSLRKWELSSIPTPITLFRSDQFNSELPDYGWGKKCCEVTVIPVGGSHQLKETDVLRQRFLRAVEEAARNAVASPGLDSARFSPDGARMVAKVPGRGGNPKASGLTTARVREA
jgi:thioesterase domain-containing protein/acyl carrier protein